MDRRRARLILAAILGLAFALRLGYVLGQRGDPLFDHPALDEDEYVQRARALVAGHTEDRPYWQPPGIVYSLAATFEVAGPGLLAPRILHVLLGVASCALVFLIGRRLLSERAGLVAAGICAVHGVLIFECGELLPATWIVFLDLLALWLVMRARETRSPVDGGLAGLAIGVSAVFAPTILPFAIVAAVVIRKPLAIGALAAGLILPIAPVTARNHRHGGRFVLISTNGGMNLYLGNNADYRATLSIRPGPHWDALASSRGNGDPVAQSSELTSDAIDFALHHPLDELGLLAKKLYLQAHGAEIPRDTDLYAVRGDSLLLSALVWPRPIDVPDGLLIPIALVGLAALWSERRRLAAPLWLLATIVAAGTVFFASSRHRAPALPVFALLAAGGAPIAFARWRWRAIAATAVLVVVLNIPTWETSQSYAGERELYIGLRAKDRNDLEAARAAFRTATELAPDDPRAWFELGIISDPPEAIAAWRRAAALDPLDRNVSRRLAQALVRSGDTDGAIAALEAMLAAHPGGEKDSAPDHANLAFLLARRGKPDAAMTHLRATLAADPRYAHAMLPRMIDAAKADPSIDPAFKAALDEVHP